eukprot:2799664-Lingulodinium_polyedra.AAC.1
MRAAVLRGIPTAVENPASSFLWESTPFKLLAEFSSPQECIVDYCAFKVPWRKRTRFWAWHVDLANLGPRCTGRATCQFSGKPR